MDGALPTQMSLLIFGALVLACFSTRDTASCSDYDLQLSAIIENNNVLFTDVVSFDEFMAKKLNTTSLLQDLNCDPTKSTYNGPFIEERRLYLCAYYAGASIQCDDLNENRKYMCSSSCLDYSAKIQSQVFPNGGCVETSIGIRQSSVDIIKNSCYGKPLPQYRYLSASTDCVSLRSMSNTENTTLKEPQNISSLALVLIVLGTILVIVTGIFVFRKYKKKTVQSIKKEKNQVAEKVVTSDVDISPVSLEGKNVLVMHPYNPTLDDELDLKIGDFIRVTTVFGDGWYLGYNLSSHKEGFFPSACVRKASD
eukprot:NODE_38_length_30618_cov_0.377142.p9 type:complete len:310 gc:universal NODE_38_length_30618_cov_0.377142:9562-8633(-)